MKSNMLRFFSVGVGAGDDIHKTAGKPWSCIDESNQKHVITSIKVEIILPLQKRAAIDGGLLPSPITIVKTKHQVGMHEGHTV